MKYTELRQKMQFNVLFYSSLRRYESIVHQSQTGVLDDSDWEGLRNTMVGLLCNPGLRDWWADNEHNFNPGFRDFVRAAQLAEA